MGDRACAELGGAGEEGEQLEQARSLGLCAWSVLKQWRPFLFSGLFYLAVAYGFGFRWIGEHVPDDIDGPFRIGLALLGVIVGLLVMYLAWRAPEWALKIRLARWATGGSASS